MPSDSPTLMVEVEEKGPCSRLLKITVPASRVDREIEQTFKNVMKAAQFPGFRPGKAPRRLVEARLGPRVLDDVKERLVETVVGEAIEEKGLEPVGGGRLDWEKVTVARGTDLIFDIELDVRPVFEVPELSGLVVKRPDLVISDEAVDRALEEARKEAAEIEDAGDAPLAEGGIAHLRVSLRSGDEVLLEDAEVDWQHPSKLLGGMPVDGLNDGLLGKKAGEEVEFTAILPEDYRDATHRGREATISVKVAAVSKVDMPALDDKFAESMDYDDLAEMRTEIRKQLERRAEAQADRLLDDAIVAALLDAVPFDVPPSLVSAEAGRMLRRYEMTLRQQGVPEESVVAQVLQAKEEAETRVTRDIRASFVLERIAKDRKVFVTETEVDQEIASMAANYNRSPDEMAAYVERNNLVGSLRSTLKERKTLRELRDVVKIEEAAAPAGEEGPGA